MNRKHITSLLTLILLTIVYTACSRYHINQFDEGVILTGALRVLHGDIPSLDFYTNYGPAQFYILSTLFDLFAPNALVARIYDSFILALITIIAYKILAKNCHLYIAAAGTVFITAILLKYRLPLYPITPVIAFSLLVSQNLSELFISKKRNLKLLSISAGVSCILVFRYDIFIIIIASLIFSFSAVTLLFYDKNSLNRNAVTIAKAWCVILSLPAATLAILFYAGILTPALNNLIEFSTSNYVDTRSLPFPGLNKFFRKPDIFIFIYFTPLVCLIATSCIISTATRSNLRDNLKNYPWLITLIVYTSTSCFLYTKGIIRVSTYHMLLANIPATVVLFLLLQRVTLVKIKVGQLINWSIEKIVYASSAAMAVILLLYMINLIVRDDLLYESVLDLSTNAELPALSVLKISQERELAAEYLIHHTLPTDRIHSATGRHDKILLNDVSLYFICQRLPASRWHQYDPGVQTTKDIQLEMIRDLEARNVQYVVQDESWDDKYEQNESQFSSGIHLFDDYLQANYANVASFDKIHVMKRINKE